MAGNFHQTIAIGTVGRLDDLRYTQSGTAVLGFSLAVNEYWNDNQTNERREKTTWYKCNAWQNTAETLNKYLSVGDNIMLTGNVSASAYTDNEGNPRASLELRVDKFQLLGRRGESDNTGDGESYDPVSNKIVDDIPF